MIKGVAEVIGILDEIQERFKKVKSMVDVLQVMVRIWRIKNESGAVRESFGGGKVAVGSAFEPEESLQKGQ